MFTLQYSNGIFYYSNPQSPADWQHVFRDNVILLPTHSFREESNEGYTMTNKMTNKLTNRSTSERVFFVSRYDTHLPVRSSLRAMQNLLKPRNRERPFLANL